jgi:tetratricopeptide (TPR) repeat protein
MPRLFVILASLPLLVLLWLMAWNAPISGDEEVHYVQAKKNLDYFRTLGADTTALYTPITHLRDYGQGFDNLTTLAVAALDIENPYRFRHLANATVTWLIIVTCGLMLWHLTGSRWAALVSMLLLFISPRFVGHGLNNLKDIPFALGYSVATYAMVRLLDHFPKYEKRHLLLLIAGTAFAISIRVGGVLLLCYLWAFAFFRWYQWYVQNDATLQQHRTAAWKTVPWLLAATVGSYFAGLLFWPYGLENPLLHPWLSLKLMHDYPTTVRQIFEGNLYWSEHFPWYYALKYILITIPLPVIAGLAAVLLFGRRIAMSDNMLRILFIVITAGFPLFYTAATGSNLYGGWRQLLFVYPALLMAGTYGLHLLWTRLQHGWARWMLIALMLAASFSPVRHLLVNHPYYTIYFNAFAGWTDGAYGQYEWDYYFTGFKEAYEALHATVSKDMQDGDREVRIATNFLIRWYFDTTRHNIKPVVLDYYKRGYYDWDYGIFCNTFVHPYQLQHGIWPPVNTIDKVVIDGKPVSIVIKREQTYDYEAFVELSDGNPERARAAAARALQEDPRNESALLLKATAESEMKLHMEALQTLEQLLDIYPENDDAEDLRGEILFTRGHIRTAEAVWKSIIRRNYKYYHAYVNLSTAALTENRAQEAIQWLRTCLGLNPFYRPAVLALADLYMQQGDTEKAAWYYKRANSL